MKRIRVVALVAAMVAAFAACGSTPQMPSDDTAMLDILTGPTGGDFLRSVSEYDWGDDGRTIAKRFQWIGRDAASSDAKTAQDAGEAAGAIAEFLGANADALFEVSAGWFGLQKKPFGQLNPQLARAYASALEPFQGGMIGDTGEKQSFGFSAESEDALVTKARNIFAVINTDEGAGAAFDDAAYERVREYLRAYARAVVRGSPDRVALRYAAQLAGVVDGGTRESGDEKANTRSSQYWINWAGCELALASGARPGDRDIPTRFFSTEGPLLSPDNLPSSELDAYATAVANYAFHHGAPTMGTDFDGWYEDSAGK